MSLVNDERILSGKEIRVVSKEIQKKVIKYASISVAGVSLSKVIVISSKNVDTFFIKQLPLFLKSSNFTFMRYIAVPNWFSLCMILCLILSTWADMKIVRNEMLDKKKAKNKM